jgi:hypothetical protein
LQLGSGREIDFTGQRQTVFRHASPL